MLQPEFKDIFSTVGGLRCNRMNLTGLFYFMPPFIDLTNKKFNRLLVISLNKKQNKRIYWNCICDCGNKCIVASGAITTGHSTSCGCQRRESIYKANIKHGLTLKDRVYSSWVHMKQRCYNKNNNAYKNYGGRGIIVCDEWKDNFICFRDWAVINGYEKNLTIDRKDVNGNYEPSNCKWSTIEEQNYNKRNTVFITINGEQVNTKVAKNKYGIKRKLIYKNKNKNAKTQY